jgi:uncharacterized membrane protein
MSSFAAIASMLDKAISLADILKAENADTARRSSAKRAPRMLWSHFSGAVASGAYSNVQPWIRRRYTKRASMEFSCKTVSHGDVHVNWSLNLSVHRIR